MKKALNIFLKIFKIVFIVFILLCIVFTVVNKLSDSRSIFGYRIYTINDNTMYSKYKYNDVVLVKNVKASKLKKGDNIAYHESSLGSDGRVIFHKIVEVKKDKKTSFITKGINSSYLDPEISSKKVIGKVVCVIPVISIFHRILKTQVGFFLLIFLPLLIIILDQIFKTKKDIHREKEMIVLGMIEKKKKKKSVLEQDDGEIEIL